MQRDFGSGERVPVVRQRRYQQRWKRCDWQCKGAVSLACGASSRHVVLLSQQLAWRLPVQCAAAADSDSPR